MMRLFRRRSSKTPKAAALAEARKATARMRREKEELERYRSRKQAAPVEGMTPNQWLGSGS